jgi:hypothetical protein
MRRDTTYFLNKRSLVSRILFLPLSLSHEIFRKLSRLSAWFMVGTFFKEKMDDV